MIQETGILRNSAGTNLVKWQTLFPQGGFGDGDSIWRDKHSSMWAMNWNAMSLLPLQVAGDASRCETRKILWPSLHYGSGLINVDPCWRDGASDGS